jgi:thiamine-monophosphate kinase
MLPDTVKNALSFYFITDHGGSDLSPLEQVICAVQAGATLIQYRNKEFSSSRFAEVKAIRDFCKCNGVPFVVNDNILLAKAVDADGVHVGQGDESPAAARGIMGEHALVGVSVSTLDELRRTDFSGCDYIGSGPVFATATKADAKAVTGLSGLGAIIRQTDLPVVAIGGIDSSNAKSCFEQGADGVSVISAVSRAESPEASAQILARVCGCSPREIVRPWADEFGLIEKLLKTAGKPLTGKKDVTRIAPGDDAGLLNTLKNPVITTDTQKEGVHFILDWQTPEEIGRKSVAITLSDLAACYAVPVSLFINLALPSYISDPFVESLYRGIRDALGIYSCALGGGNISRSAEFSIDLFAVGEGRDDLFPTRSAAASGDGLYCTGPLGLARAGFSCLEKKDAGFPDLVSKFISPSARFDAAKVLAENEVACAMDISDGLAGDAVHIARASHVTIEFDLKPRYFDPDLVSFCKKYALNPETVVLEGGEDYQLLFACPPEVFDSIRGQLPEAFPLGRCHAHNGNYLANLPLNIRSFQHGNHK